MYGLYLVGVTVFIVIALVFQLLIVSCLKMSLIWNNRNYKFVSNDDEWDHLTYVMARKLIVTPFLSQVTMQLIENQKL